MTVTSRSHATRFGTMLRLRFPRAPACCCSPCSRCGQCRLQRSGDASPHMRCIAKESFVAHSLPRMFLKVSSEKISVKQRAWTCVAEKMHTPNSPYAICFFYRTNLLASWVRLHCLACIGSKTVANHGKQIRPHALHSLAHASSSACIIPAINSNNRSACFRKVAESESAKMCTRFSRLHDPNRTEFHHAREMHRDMHECRPTKHSRIDAHT